MTGKIIEPTTITKYSTSSFKIPSSYEKQKRESEDSLTFSKKVPRPEIQFLHSVILGYILSPLFNKVFKELLFDAKVIKSFEIA